MRMMWICIVLAIVAGAVAIYSGAPASAVLIIGLLFLCCGGMMFGMRKMNGDSQSKSENSNRNMPIPGQRHEPRR